MSQPGKPSTAHEYGKGDQCIHCGTHRVNVERLKLECTWAREHATDEAAKQQAVKRGK